MQTLETDLTSGDTGRHAAALTNLSRSRDTLSVAERQDLADIVARFVRSTIVSLTGHAQPVYSKDEAKEAGTIPATGELGSALNELQALRKTGGVRVDLKKLPADRVDLSSFDFSGFDLAGSDFWGARLDEARFQGADLTQTWLRYAAAWGSNFDSATVQGSNLTGTGLADSAFTRLRLTDVNLGGADLSRADIAGSDFSNVESLDGTNLLVRRHEGARFGEGVPCTADTLWPPDLAIPTCSNGQRPRSGKS